MSGGDLAEAPAPGAVGVEGAGSAQSGVATAGPGSAAAAAAELPGRLDGEPGRSRADRELVAALAACGFSGPRWDRFAEELARYGVSVLCGWMSSGYVFTLAARRGFPLRPAGRELEELHRDPDLRQDLAVMVVAVALRRFRQHALVGGGWHADAGASLTTYFLGTCLSVFPNEFRRYRAQGRRWQAQDAADEAAGGRQAATGTDPADVVAGVMGVRAELARADSRTRAIVALRMDGYHLEEIAEMLSAQSARAVEGVLYRWRVKEMQRWRDGGA